MTSCDLVFIDLNTQEPVFRIQIYGVTREEMLRVPPPLSIARLCTRHGIDPLRFATSIFHVEEARKFNPRRDDDATLAYARRARMA